MYDLTIRRGNESKMFGGSENFCPTHQENLGKVKKIFALETHNFSNKSHSSPNTSQSLPNESRVLPNEARFSKSRAVSRPPEPQV